MMIGGKLEGNVVRICLMVFVLLVEELIVINW